MISARYRVQSGHRVDTEWTRYARTSPLGSFSIRDQNATSPHGASTREGKDSDANTFAKDVLQETSSPRRLQRRQWTQTHKHHHNPQQPPGQIHIRHSKPIPLPISPGISNLTRSTTKPSLVFICKIQYSIRPFSARREILAQEPAVKFHGIPTLAFWSNHQNPQTTHSNHPTSTSISGFAFLQMPLCCDPRDRV